MANIGFVGLGHMGLPMAINLIKAGHQVTGYDIQPEALAALTQAGGHVTPELSTLAKNNTTLITMLQTGHQVISVCCDPGGLYAHAAAHTLHIDCSTIDISSTHALQQHAKQHHILSIDAPVSGGVAGATAASLTFMVGGDPSACFGAHPILQAMGKQIIMTGESGTGQAAKMCNNMVLGISMLAVSEAFLLADHLNLTPQKLHEVLSNASGRCWVTERYLPVAGLLDNVPADHEYQAGFMLAMMLKDMRLSQDAAQQAGLTTPMANLATQYYQKATDAGMGALDFSAIIKYLEKTK